jgi:hypothetical protein
VRGASFARHANMTIVDQIGDHGEEYHKRLPTDDAHERIFRTYGSHCSP